jgi:ribonuclease P protein component
MERLTKTADFALCYKKGRMAKGHYVVVYARGNNLADTRVGFSVSKKLGKAVKRNKVKRRLREIVRRERLVTGVDIVVAARMAATKAEFQQLSAEVHEALNRLGVLCDPQNKS